MGKTGEDKQFVEDLFSTTLYTGNGSTQTINNGIDLAGKGGMVWLKRRDGVENNRLFTTEISPISQLSSNTTGAAINVTGISIFDSFNSNGFTLGSNGPNGSGFTYASWTFRKAPKFFDVVTYTGNGVDNRVLNHSLGIPPGMIIVKRATGGTENWPVWHRSVSAGGAGNLFLNLTNALSGNKINDATASTFTLSASDTSHNAVGSTYVAYLFAHDTSTDGLIQCGSFTGSSAISVNLGWEPQYLMFKRIDGTGGQWQVFDTMRGLDYSRMAYLYPNASTAEETGSSDIKLTPTGFTSSTGYTTGTYIYMAIRRGPMKVPTDGTKVFMPVAWTGTGTNPQAITAGFPVDMFFNKKRTDAGYGFDNVSRLASATNYLLPFTTSAEATNARMALDSNAKVFYGNTSGNWWNQSSSSNISYYFSRAPGFFDVVCYTGNNVSGRQVPHSLGVVPNFAILKCRSSSTEGANGPADWFVAVGSSVTAMHSPGIGDGALNKTNALGPAYNLTGRFTATTFEPTYMPRSTISGDVAGNGGGRTYVAYLFASCPGVSKVGSYTGNGSSQTINCGFAAGARFVLIKRTDSTGDWYVWDTARGIVASNDPHLSLNTTAAEVTTNDTIDPDSSGFIVNQVSATNVNVNAASYIYLAIA